MKLYYFRPESYGAEYITMGITPQEALSNLKIYLYNKTIIAKDDPDYFYKDEHKERYDDWKKSKPNKLPYGYSIEEYNNREVIVTELA